MDIRAPVVCWENGPLRIVAGPCTDESHEGCGGLALEFRTRDSLGGDSWREIPMAELRQISDDVADAVLTLMVEAVYRVDVVRPWVRDMVRGMREEFGGRAAIEDGDHDHDEGPPPGAS